MNLTYIFKEKLLLTVASFVISVGAYAQSAYSSHLNGGKSGEFVGTIEDNFEVSTIGVANYDIPIKLPSGTNGFAPKIDVAYSSSNGMGLFGYGFDLSSISIISRVPSDYLHENKAGVVDFSEKLFSLDGTRLLPVGYSGNEYRTEQNSFSKIIALGTSNNPSSFTAQGKDGITYTYTPLHVALGNGICQNEIFWLLTKASDRHGNYYSISYKGDANTHSYVPYEIKYTGNANAGLLPYITIRFDNFVIPKPRTTFISGEKVISKYAINSISTSIRGKEVSMYTFCYNSDRNIKLVSVKLTKNNNCLNPTSFTWYNDSNYNLQESASRDISELYNTSIGQGDFNGDGKTDFVVFPKPKASCPWKYGYHIYLSQGKDFKDQGYVRFSNIETKYKFHFWTHQAICGDFDGDGYDDVLFVHTTNTGVVYTDLQLYLTKHKADGTVSLQLAKEIDVCPGDWKFIPMDLNGDGRMDIFGYTPTVQQFSNYNYKATGKEYCIYYTGKNSKDLLSNSLLPQQHQILDLWSNVEAIDYDGDGIAEIVNVSNDKSVIYRLDINQGLIKTDKQFSLEGDHHWITGDFNGDGKTDLLVTGYKDYVWSNWMLRLSNGSGDYFLGSKGEPQIEIKTLFNEKDYNIMAVDINGDGLDDLFAVPKKTVDDKTIPPLVYLNNGNNTFSQYLSDANIKGIDKWQYQIGDFDGDGKKDVFCWPAWVENQSWKGGFKLFMMPEEQTNLLKSVDDGYGIKTEIKYKYLSDPSIFNRGEDTEYPLVSVGSSWPVVSEVISSNGVGGDNSVSYSYENALFHKLGRGFIGFEKFTSIDNISGEKKVTEFAADKNKYLLNVCSETTSINGHTTAYKQYTHRYKAYNFNGKSSDVFGYDLSSTTDVTFEPGTGTAVNSVNTQNTYDDYGNLTKSIVTSADVTTTTTNKYDDNVNSWILGRLSESTVTKSGKFNSVSRKSSFKYDGLGFLTEESTEPNNRLGITKTYSRDSCGNIIQSVTTANDGSGSLTKSTSYDADGRFVLSETNSSYSSQNGKSITLTSGSIIDPITEQMTSSTNSDGITTNYTYDVWGHLTHSSSPLNDDYSYVGWAKGVADAPSNALTFTYSKSQDGKQQIVFFDELSRKIRTVHYSVSSIKIYEDITYNETGQVKDTSLPYFAGDSKQVKTNHYDEFGRLDYSIAPDGGRVSYSYNGLVSTTTDALNHTTSSESNNLGKVVKTVDAAGNEVFFNYDVDGNIITITGPKTTVEIAYDIFGRRTSLKDPDYDTESYSYDAFGHMLSKSNSKGTTTYEYDPCGRLVKENLPSGEGYKNITYRSGTFISEVDNEESVINATRNKTSYTYDNFGRLTSVSEELAVNGEPAKTSKLIYAYNNKNQLDRMVYPKGLSLKYEYADNGALCKIYSPENAKVSWHLASENANGSPTQVNLGNNIDENISYDVNKGTVTNINISKVVNWAYGYDSNGNLISRRDCNRGLVEIFEYNNRDMLYKTCHNSNLVETINYDESGNITSKTGIGSTFRYVDNSNRLQGIVGGSYVPVLWNTIDYTSFNKISYIETAHGSLELSYGNDFSRCCSKNKIGDNVSRTWYYNNFFEETQDSGKTVFKSYIYGPEGLIAYVVNENNTSKTFYVHSNYKNTVLAISDANGKTVFEYSYDAWGRRRNPNDWSYFDDITEYQTDFKYGFDGHEEIDLMELVNMDGRMYDPVLGRFLSPDPAIQDPGNAVSLNRYAYCMNNPLTLTDPSGYSWLGKNWKSLLSAAVGVAAAVFTAGTFTAVDACVFAGAVGGLAGSMTSALLNGCNVGKIFSSTIQGTVMGAFRAATNYGCGEIPFWYGNIAAHTLNEGLLTVAEGGKFGHGFLEGFLNIAGENLNSQLNFESSTASLISNAVIGGTVSELTGGDFANGAITSSYSYLFNKCRHSRFGYLQSEFIPYEDMKDGKQSTRVWNGLNNWKENVIMIHGLCNKDQYDSYGFVRYSLRDVIDNGDDFATFLSRDVHVPLAKDMKTHHPIRFRLLSCASAAIVRQWVSQGCLKDYNIVFIAPNNNLVIYTARWSNGGSNSIIKPENHSYYVNGKKHTRFGRWDVIKTR